MSVEWEESVTAWPVFSPDKTSLTRPKRPEGLGWELVSTMYAPYPYDSNNSVIGYWKRRKEETYRG